MACSSRQQSNAVNPLTVVKPAMCKKKTKEQGHQDASSSPTKEAVHSVKGEATTGAAFKGLKAAQSHVWCQSPHQHA